MGIQWLGPLPHTSPPGSLRSLSRGRAAGVLGVCLTGHGDAAVASGPGGKELPIKQPAERRWRDSLRSHIFWQAFMRGLGLALRWACLMPNLAEIFFFLAFM